MIQFNDGDIEEMSRMAAEIAMPKVENDYGAFARENLVQLNQVVRKFYKYLSPEHLQEVVIYISCVEDRNQNYSVNQTQPKKVIDLSTLTQIELQSISIQILSDTDFLVYQGEIIDIEEARESGILYHYKYGREKYFIKSEEIKIPSFSSFPSSFAFPTFKDLDNALEAYGIRRAKRSTCEILKRAWNEEEKIFFKEKPEIQQRKSLYDFLDITLRAAEVSEEQNVDDTQPIDIKVSWDFANHLALIEVKWLGKSIKEDRSGFTSKYYDARAQEGFDQIINYMNVGKDRFFHKQSIGYLVVFDGRRYQTNEETTEISKKNGFHYENKDLSFNPDPSTVKNVETPIRFFMEPICTG